MRQVETEAMVRSLVALGTVLLLPGGCGSEVKTLANERSIGSMVQRVAGSHGEMAGAVSKEIMSICTVLITMRIVKPFFAQLPLECPKMGPR
jgi:hypothetical protein